MFMEFTTCPLLVHDLSMACSWLSILNLFKTLSSFDNALLMFMSCSLFVHNLFITSSWLVHNQLTIFSWLVLNASFDTHIVIFGQDMCQMAFVSTIACMAFLKDITHTTSNFFIAKSCNMGVTRCVRTSGKQANATE